LNEKNLIDVKKLSVLAITALLVTGISGITSAAAAKPAPTTTSLPTTSLTTLITSLINSVGDDTFSTIDLTTLLATFTSPAPTPLHTFSSVARTQPTSSSSGTSTQHFGPYATTNDPDSGTCGNDWATDSFDRHLTIFQNKDDGSLLVVEQFKNGAFVTPAPADDPARSPNGPSPGACDTMAPPTGNGGTVATGIQGSFHGFLVIPLPAGTTQNSNDPHCNATTSSNTDCTGTIFIETHFTSCYPATCPVVFSSTTFFFHYSAGDQQLIAHEWQNASPDRGGNKGDIRSA